MSKYNPVDSATIAELIQIVGEKYVWTDRDKLEPYSHDEVTGEKYVHYPEAVVFPETAAQVAEVLKLANRRLIPVTPRGAGSGYACASVAYEGGIVLSTERMNQVLEIDELNMVMVVEPGVRTADVHKLAIEKGYLYPGEPSSSDSSFIGGNVATNAGGLKAVKYGTTRQHVLGLEIVTPEGEVVTLGGKLKKDSTGYGLTQLMIGSEGTLGVVTKVYLKMAPRLQHVVDLLAIFPTLESAINIVAKVMQSPINPLCVEFMDNKGIRCAEEFLHEKLPHSDKGYYVILSIDGNNEDVLDEQCVFIDELCSANGALEVLVADPAKIWKARKSFGEANRARSLIFSAEDTVVPMSRIPDVVQKFSELSVKYGVNIHIAAHAADGNVHADILKESMPLEKWLETLPLLQDELYAFIYSVGGKLSGEHGIGYKRLALMKKYCNPVELKMMKAIKLALDPNQIMNPGKIFSLD
jgi:glycolate oxidase